MIDIRFLKSEDLEQAAQVHKEAFVRQQLSYEWLECNLKAFPRVLCFVAESDGKIAGYIVWMQKSGFRPGVVLELEQIAVLPSMHGHGIGQELIEKSLPRVREQLEKRNARLKHIIVTTRADNQAQRLYRKTLGAEVEATISNLYSADEVLMIARNI